MIQLNEQQQVFRARIGSYRGNIVLLDVIQILRYRFIAHKSLSVAKLDIARAVGTVQYIPLTAASQVTGPTSQLGQYLR